jgi:hypothetical protein
MGNSESSADANADPNFPPPPPTAEETALVEALRSQVEPLFAERSLPEEMGGHWKLLKYIRGHGSVAAGRAAFEATAVFYNERNMHAVRKELLDFEVESGTLPWPYYLPRFAPLLEGVWKGNPPAVHDGFDAHGNPVTFTKMSLYNFKGVISAGLGDLWLDLVAYCNVYFDVLMHRLYDKHGRPVARHDIVDLTGIGITTIGWGGMQLLKRMGESSEHFPEMIARTTGVNVGRVGRNLFKVARPFLPKQTAAKMNLVGKQYEDHLRGYGVHTLPRGLRRENAAAAEAEAEAAAEAEAEAAETQEELAIQQAAAVSGDVPAAVAEAEATNE